MLPIQGDRLGRCRLGRAIPAELTQKVPYVSLGVGKLPHVVRGASDVGCTLVARESLAQPSRTYARRSPVPERVCPARRLAKRSS